MTHQQTAVRVLPLRVPVIEGESLDSWIEALARRHGVAPRTVALGLGITGRRLGLRHLIDASDPADRRRIEHATGLAPRRVDSAVTDPASVVPPLGSGGSRYCPSCLADNGGRWPLVWRSSWRVACSRHRVLLADTCPACGTAPRRNLPAGTDPVPVASCTHVVGWSRCGADLSATAAIPAGPEVLDTQDWVDHLIDRRPPPQAPGRAGMRRDLPVLLWWLLRHDHDAITAAANRVHPGRPRTAPEARLWTHGDAALTAALLARAQTILAGSDRDAVDALRRIVSAMPNRHLPPADITRAGWHAMRSAFPSRFLRAIDPDLPPLKRLRHKSVVPSAERPGNGPDRVSMLPQMLWPDWSARLLPPTGYGAERLRTVLATSLLLPGRHDHHELSDGEKALNPHVRRRDIAVLLQNFSAPPNHLDAVLTLLCRIADHLDQTGSAIDYRRRRERLPTEIMTREQWRELACSIGEHPGDAPSEGRYLRVQRYLHQLLCGADLDDPRHPLAFEHSSDRSRYLEFTTSLTTPLRRALTEHAHGVLADLGIDEPVTWSPPAQLADGLELPGIDLDQLDLDTVHRLAIDQRHPLGEVAATVGANIEHIRLALERLDLPQRQWAKSTPPSAWRRKQQAAATLTPDFFQRECVRHGRSFTDIGRTSGWDRALVARLAKEAGITPQKGPPAIHIDPEWLAEQYTDRRRSTSDIAAELGITQMTVSRTLERLGIPARPPGVESFPQMLTVHDDLPADVRTAVEGKLRGWHRLHRFHLAMRFPTLLTAATYLQAPPSALITQLQRLERDLGEPLFQRSTPRQPQIPTERGQALLTELDSDRVQALIRSELRDDQLRPTPGPDDLAEAHRHFNQRPRTPRTPQPFADTPVGRFRVSRQFLALLTDLDQRPGEFYGREVIRRTGIDGGTLYPMLHRMHNTGWLVSRREDEQTRPPEAHTKPGPRRTYYTLTSAGARALRHELSRCDRSIARTRRKRRGDATA